MNLLGKGTISAALFAATASVVMASPAQAFTLVDSAFTFGADTTVKFTFDGSVSDGNSASDGWFVKRGLLDFGIADGEGENREILFDSLKPVDHGATATFTFLKGVSYNLFLGVETSYDSDTYESILFTDRNLNDPINEQFAILSFTESSARVGIEDLYLGRTGFHKYDGDYNDYIVDAAAVPTPAAVLPVLGGLLGMASKRKREEKNA